MRTRVLPSLLLGLLLSLPLQAQVLIQGMATDPPSPLQSGETVQFLATATASDGGPLEYRWDFGDGTPRTNWLAVPVVEHSYLSAGTFTVLLQVRHASLGPASATSSLVVRLPPAAPARHSSTILTLEDRREVWVVNPDHGTLAVLDADLLELLDELEVGGNPGSLAVDGSGQVWVSLQDDDAIRRVDPDTRSITADVALGYGARPVSLVFDASGWGYVVLAGPGRVQRFLASDGTLDAQLDVGPSPEAILLSGDNSRLLVSRLVSADDAGTVWSIALPMFSTVEPLALQLDTSSPDSGTAARGLPNYIAALAMAEDHSSLWYGGKKDNILRGMWREGQALTFESTLRSLLGRVNTDTGLDLMNRRMDFDDAGRVSALLLSPGSSHLFVALETNNALRVVDPWNRRVLGSIDVGRAPRGLAFDQATRRLFVQNFLSRSVSVFAVGELLDNGVSDAVSLGSISSASTEPLSAEVLKGKQIFYNAMDVRMAQDGYFSCAACHLDGRGDGRVWDFTQLGEGLRNTTSLLGSAGMGRGPVHWTGNFDEIQDFEGPIRNLFGGIGFMDDSDYFSGNREHPLGAPKAGFSEDLDALAAYVTSLDTDDRSPYRNADGSLSSEGTAGRLLFEHLSCHRCHAGEAYTDSPEGYRHDVGTLTPASGQRLGGELLALDTPSLRGLFSSAPYLHDGSAATLEAVLIERNADGMHGAAESLSPLERQQLIAFLLQIDAAEPAVADAPQLLVTSPAADTVLLHGDTVSLEILTDLPQIIRVDYRVDETIVASAFSAPWSANWTATSLGLQRIYADVLHDLGEFNTLSAPRGINVVIDAVFANGFEFVE